MKNIFELKKGKLIFEDDKIIILDNAFNKKIYIVFLLVLFLTVYSVITITSKEQISYAFWGLLGSVGLLRLVVELLNSKQSEISLEEVKYLKIKHFFFKEFLIIKLVNNKVRVVEGILNIERLDDFINSPSISQSPTFK